MPRRKTIGRNPLAKLPAGPDGSAAPRPPSRPGSAAPEPTWRTDPADTGQAVELWATAVETGLRASFEAYNAFLATGLAAVQTTAASERALLRSWGGLAEQVQRVTLTSSFGVMRFWVAPR